MIIAQMTDPVAISLIGALASIAASLIGVFNNHLVRKNYRATKDTNETITKLEKNTNGMQVDLLRATSESEFAKGHLAGVETATTLIKTEPPKL